MVTFTLQNPVMEAVDDVKDPEGEFGAEESEGDIAEEDVENDGD